MKESRQVPLDRVSSCRYDPWQSLAVDGFWFQLHVPPTPLMSTLYNVGQLSINGGEFMLGSKPTCFVTISCSRCILVPTPCPTQPVNVRNVGQLSINGGEFMLGSKPTSQQIHTENICREDSSQILLCRSSQQEVLLLTDQLTGSGPVHLSRSRSEYSC